MKKSNFLRTIATAALFAVAGMSAFAQYTASPTNVNSVNDAQADSVVVGARMPYFVTPDPIIAAMIPATMNYSIFKWTLTDNSDVVVPALTPLKYSGAATAAPPQPGYFVENEISVVWSVATGQYKVKTIERSVPVIGTGCEQGAAVSKPVTVIAVPTIAFNGPNDGACGISTYNVPIQLSGAGPWKISYTIQIESGATATVTDQVVTNGNMPYTASITTLPLAVNLATAPLTGASGIYDIVITKITDRISAKSLNNVVGTLPGTNLFKVATYPTPVTQPIQHVKNI